MRPTSPQRLGGKRRHRISRRPARRSRSVGDGCRPVRRAGVRRGRGCGSVRGCRSGFDSRIESDTALRDPKAAKSHRVRNSTWPTGRARSPYQVAGVQALHGFRQATSDHLHRPDRGSPARKEVQGPSPRWLDRRALDMRSCYAYCCDSHITSRHITSRNTEEFRWLFPTRQALSASTNGPLNSSSSHWPRRTSRMSRPHAMARWSLRQ